MVRITDVDERTMRFSGSLLVARIARRPNRFVIDVELDGHVVACHCPTTGRIGEIVLDGLYCLLSTSENPKRKTKYTVEAISVDAPDTAQTRLSWIGINQNDANRYIETALRADLLPELIHAETIAREQTLGNSKLDFLINEDTYIEVKTPLQRLQVPLGDHIRTRRVEKFDSTDRFTRHFTQLGDSLDTRERAILIICFLYDNPGFVVEASARHTAVHENVRAATAKGVEVWQVNFELTYSGVAVTRCTDLTSEFLG